MDEPRLNFFPKVEFDPDNPTASILVPDAPKDFTDAEYDPPSQEVVFTQGHMGYGRGKTNEMFTVRACSICHGPYLDYGNNAKPINEGRCCDKCNKEIVTPTRIRRMNKGLKAYEGGLDEERVQGINQAIMENNYHPGREI